MRQRYVQHQIQEGEHLPSVQAYSNYQEYKHKRLWRVQTKGDVCRRSIILMANLRWFLWLGDDLPLWKSWSGIPKAWMYILASYEKGEYQRYRKRCEDLLPLVDTRASRWDPLASSCPILRSPMTDSWIFRHHCWRAYGRWFGGDVVIEADWSVCLCVEPPQTKSSSVANNLIDDFEFFFCNLNSSMGQGLIGRVLCS